MTSVSSAGMTSMRVALPTRLVPKCLAGAWRPPGNRCLPPKAPQGGGRPDSARFLFASKRGGGGGSGGSSATKRKSKKAQQE